MKWRLDVKHCFDGKVVGRVLHVRSLAPDQPLVKGLSNESEANNRWLIIPFLLYQFSVIFIKIPGAFWSILAIASPPPCWLSNMHPFPLTRNALLEARCPLAIRLSQGGGTRPIIQNHWIAYTEFGWRSICIYRNARKDMKNNERLV
jgi:hypothetical protein